MIGIAEYDVTMDKNGYYYAHKRGYPGIPVLGSISRSKRHAYEIAAGNMGMTYDQYIEYRKRNRRCTNDHNNSPNRKKRV